MGLAYPQRSGCAADSAIFSHAPGQGGENGCRMAPPPYSLPAGLRWVSRHDLSAYRRGHRFSEVCVSSPIRSIADWRHTHSFADVEGGTLITDDIHTPRPQRPAQKFSGLPSNIKLLGDLSFLSRIAALCRRPAPHRWRHRFPKSDWSRRDSPATYCGTHGSTDRSGENAPW